MYRSIPQQIVEDSKKTDAVELRKKSYRDKLIQCDEDKKRTEKIEKNKKKDK